MNLADWRCSYCSKKPLSFLPINVPWTSVQRENHCLTCTSSCLQRQIAFQKKCRKQLQELDFNQELQLEEQLYSPRLAEPEFKWIKGDHVYLKVGKTEHPAQVISKPYLVLDYILSHSLFLKSAVPSLPAHFSKSIQSKIIKLIKYPQQLNLEIILNSVLVKSIIFSESADTCLVERPEQIII